jgi:spore maturation protein CgeB
MKYTYGDSNREYSYEYYNFYLTLIQLGHDVELYDYMVEMKSFGKVDMNQRLLARIKAWRPELAMFSLYTDQFEPFTIKELRLYTKTLCFFHDDTWRIEYSQYWASHFDFFTTPDISGEIKYRRTGLKNAIYFPFGCNEKIFRRLEVPKKYDVSFVGGWHPYREWLISRIRKAGISVEVYGYRWPKGEIDQNGMVRLFNESCINLNLSNSASWDMRYLASSPRALINRLRSKKNIEQMKARMFEINGCGSFQLSYYVEGLAHCYEIDREIGAYADADDLTEKIKFYLAYADLRETIAAEGYERTLKDHTFASRFQTVFGIMGLVDE